MLEPNHYSVLFTGGLDSTYRLCQLAQDEKAVVQPIYIVFPDNGKSPHVRPELQREIEAQDKILDYLVNHPNTKAKILPIKRIQRDEIPKDQRIMELELFLVPYSFGWQYLYIALLARWNIGLELCHETLPEEFLNGEVKFKDINGRKWTDTTDMGKEFALIFANLTWPILGITRQQMIKDLKKWGYEGIWNHIWFCYKSVDGKPCGICDNCSVKIREGLTFLFTKEALHRFLVQCLIHLCVTDAAFPLYHDYVYRKNNLILNDRNRFLWYNRFSEMESLSNSKLKHLILNGTLKYSDGKFSEQKKRKIMGYGKNNKHKEKYSKFLRNI